MTSNILLSALAAAVSLGLVLAPQDPSFEFPAAKHVGFEAPEQTTVAAPAPATSDKVSVTFKNAPIREVLDWLKSQGVSFVVPDDAIDKESRVSLNVVDQPIETVMKALATSWSGRWQKQDAIWVFRGGQSLAFTVPDVAMVPQAKVPGRITVPDKNFTVVPPLPSADSKVWQVPVPSPMTKDQELALEKALKGMDDPKRWEEFSRSWEQWAREYEKNFRDFEKNLQGKEFKMDPKALEEMRIRVGDLPMQNFKIWKDGKELKLDGSRAKTLTIPAPSRVKGFIYSGDTTLSPGARVGTTRNMSSHNLKAIYESLTPAQDQILKTKGYLNYSDLNSKQRSLLGVIGDDNWTLSYKTDRINLTIKSDR